MYQGKKWFLTGLLSVLIIVMFIGWIGQVQSQEKYPTRAIDIIVPTLAGASSDFCARHVANFVKQKWGVPVNVINKPGGSSVPGTLEVYKANPDGYTILADSQTSAGLLELSVRDLPFKVLDRTFIAILFITPHTLYVPSTSAVRNLKDLEAEMKRDPEHFTWGSMGVVSEYCQRQLCKAMGVDISKTKPIQCRGGAEVIALLAGGHIKFGSSAPVSGYPHVQAGTIRPIGITVRFPGYPDVPTAAEQGYPTVTGGYWWGISGPPKMPSYIIDRWKETLEEALRSQEFVSKLENVGWVPFYHNSPDAREYVKKEVEEARTLWGLK